MFKTWVPAGRVGWFYRDILIGTNELKLKYFENKPLNKL